MAINAGVVTGDLVFFALAAAGMAAAAQSLGDLFAVLRIVRAAYLAWQGIRLWRAEPRVEAAEAIGHGALLAQLQRAVHGRPHAGDTSTAALMPGFVNLAELRLPDLLLLAAMLMMVTGGVNTGYAFAAGRTFSPTRGRCAR